MSTNFQFSLFNICVKLRQDTGDARWLFFAPALELREVLAELLAVLVGSEVLAGVLVELIHELDAEVYHLLHGAV